MSSASRGNVLKFLLDENVKKELLGFLKSEGFDATFKPKGLSNGELAAFSKTFKYAFSLVNFGDIAMAELKVEIPEELKQEMDEFPEIEWRLVVRRLLKQELDKLIELKGIVSKSKFTEKDAFELSGKVDKALAQRFRQSLKS